MVFSKETRGSLCNKVSESKIDIGTIFKITRDSYLNAKLFPQFKRK